MNAEEKTRALRSSTDDIAAGIRKEDPGSYGELMERVAVEEEGEMKKKGKTDRWYKKMFRGIAWGPSILLNALIGLFFW